MFTFSVATMPKTKAVPERLCGAIGVAANSGLHRLSMSSAACTLTAAGQRLAFFQYLQIISFF